MRALERFGPTIEAAGGLDAIDRERLAELVAYLIMEQGREQRRHDELMMAKPLGI